MNASRWSSRMARVGGAALVFWVVTVTAAPAGHTSTAQESGAPSARALLRSAWEAVSAASTIHRVFEASYGADLAFREPGYAHRQDEWQHGRLYRRDGERYTFLLGEQWAVHQDRKSGVAIAAARQETDDLQFLVSEGLRGWLDLDRVISSRSRIAVSEETERRTVGDGEQFRVTIVQSWGSEHTRAEDRHESTMVFWLDAVTGLPIEWETVNRDGLGRVSTRARSEYEYDIDLPANWFSYGSVLGDDPVVVGWEHLRELVEADAIASAEARVDDHGVGVEVRGVEVLPREHILIVGSAVGHPAWLGAYLTQDEGSAYRSYSLAWQWPVMLGPWAGGNGQRLDFAMVFAPQGKGTRTFSVPTPGLTWRAWGLFRSVSDSDAPPGEPRWKEEDATFSATLPLPDGPPVVHELVRDQPGE